MAETPGAVRIVFFLLHRLVQVRFRNGHEIDDNERNGEYGQRNQQQRTDIRHRRVLRNGTDHRTGQQRSQRGYQRVACTTGLNQLITTVTTATQRVQHRVNNGVEHTYAETADERAQQVHEQRGQADGHEAAEELHQHAYETRSQGHQRGLFVTDLRQQFARRNTHNQVRCKIHHVAQHAGPLVVRLPDVSERRCHVRYERHHREHEEHGDNRHGVAFVLLFSHNVFDLLFLVLLSY